MVRTVRKIKKSGRLGRVEKTRKMRRDWEDRKHDQGGLWHVGQLLRSSLFLATASLVDLVMP